MSAVRRVRPVVEFGPDAFTSLLDDAALAARTSEVDTHVPPIGGAVAWVTDGARYGAELYDGTVRWLAADELPGNVVGWVDRED